MEDHIFILNRFQTTMQIGLVLRLLNVNAYATSSMCMMGSLLAFADIG